MQLERNKKKQNTHDKLKIKQARELLYNYGYFTHNLWHIDDVKALFKCTDIKAYEVLVMALMNPATYDQVREAIKQAADQLNLKLC